MTPIELRKTLEELLGNDCTLQQAAIALRCDAHALDNWLAGKREIPGPVISALELAAACPPDRRPAAWSLKWLIDDSDKEISGDRMAEDKCRAAILHIKSHMEEFSGMAQEHNLKFLRYMLRVVWLECIMLLENDDKDQQSNGESVNRSKPKLPER